MGIDRTERGAANRRRRRHRPKKPAPESAVAVIQQAKPPVDVTKPADVPLTAAEAAEMRVHFRFLKEHRKLLDLKVNATEDLLLNGVREPTHRGVCQHLLDKVERRRVELAVQRIEPAASARLLEGIVRFSPDIAYLLLYLEVLGKAARPDATAALYEALKHIDFSEVSPAQMRRVLDLIAELTSERERPQLLFSLLQSTTFQAAFDKSAETLPAALADIVIPLRAAHAVVVRGAKNPHDARALALGAQMLLRAHEKVLRAQTPAVQNRLFELGVALSAPSKESLHGLQTLLDCSAKDERAFAERALALAGFATSAGFEPEARKTLAALLEEQPGHRTARRWLDALDGPRLGGIGIVDAPALDARGEERERFVNGVLLARQTPVWVRVGTRAHAERYARAAELARRLAIPGVASVLASGVSERGAPFLATPRLGRAANELILQKSGLRRDQALGVAGEAVRILEALAAASVKLPDARYRRFAIDDAGRLWLRDLMDAEACPPDAARATHVELGREICLDVLGRAAGSPFSDTVLGGLRAAESLVALARALDELA